MMRQQQSDTRKKPSKVCKFLLLLVGFKICLLLVVLVEPFVSVTSFLPSAETLATFFDTKPATKTAPAATSTGQQVVTAQLDSANAGVEAKNGTNASVAVADSGNNNSEPAPDFTPASAPVRRYIPGAAYAATAGTAQTQPAPAQNSLTIEALNRKQEELARREQDLRALEKELDARLVQMQGLEMRLQTMLKDAEETKNDKYKHLVDVLSNMKARQAAEVLETLDEKIAVRVLAGMRGRQAGEILTYASPQKAARLTEALARMQMPLE